MAKESPKTAAEIMAELQKDPAYQEMIQAKEKARIEFEQFLNEDEKPLVVDLISVGVQVSSVWKLVNTSAAYKEAIPVLINHLPRPYHEKNKEGIIRALTVKYAKGIAVPALLHEYHNTPLEMTHLRWLMGNCMSLVLTEDYIDEVGKIVNNKENGMSRQMFVVALGKLKSDKAVLMLQALLDDKEMAPFAIKALKKRKPTSK